MPGGPGRPAGLDAGRAWTPGGPGRRAGLDAGRAWTPGGPGRRAGLDAGRAWTPGGPGRRAGLDAGRAWSQPARTAACLDQVAQDQSLVAAGADADRGDRGPGQL